MNMHTLSKRIDFCSVTHSHFDFDPVFSSSRPKIIGENFVTTPVAINIGKFRLNIETQRSKEWRGIKKFVS